MGVPIGGQFISSFGSVLGFVPYQEALPAYGVPPPTDNQTCIDVSGWEMERTFADDETTHTGSWGCEGHNLTCTGFRLAAELLWDLYAPPNFVAQVGALWAGPQVPDAGYRFWAYVGSEQNYASPLPATPYYYFAPSAKVRTHKTIVDAAGKKMVRATIAVIGNGPIFAFGGTLNEQSQYNQFLTHCQSRNWVF